MNGKYMEAGVRYEFMGYGLMALLLWKTAILILLRICSFTHIRLKIIYILPAFENVPIVLYFFLMIFFSNLKAMHWLMLIPGLVTEYEQKYFPLKTMFHLHVSLKRNTLSWKLRYALQNWMARNFALAPNFLSPYSFQNKFDFSYMRLKSRSHVNLD